MKKSIKKEYETFATKYQGSLSTKQFQHLKKTQEKDDNWWEYALSSLSTLSKISFIHCILILFYIVGEKYFFENGYLFSLFVISIITFAYISSIMCFYGSKNKFISCLRTTTSVYIFYCFCLVIFVLTPKINLFFVSNNLTLGELSTKTVHFFALFICFQSLIVRRFANFYHKQGLDMRENALYNMRDNIDSISVILESASVSREAVDFEQDKINLLTDNTKTQLICLLTKKKELTISKAVELTNYEISHIYENKMEKHTAILQFKNIATSPNCLLIIIVTIVTISLLCFCC